MLLKEIEMNVDYNGYSKHTRSAYFIIDSLVGAKDRRIDVVFIPEPDISRAGSLVNWMKLNFDLQICANAILSNSAYSYAPFEIAKKEAFLRFDKYCYDVLRVKPTQPKKKYKTQHELILSFFNNPSGKMKEYGIKIVHTDRWNYEQFEETNGPRWCCMCSEIAPARVMKYEDRGYKINTGSYANYLKWKENQGYHQDYEYPEDDGRSIKFYWNLPP